MLLYPYRRKHQVWLAATSRIDGLTAQGIELATAKATAALREGNLLSPLEAMLLAGPEARKRETLFSIACATAGACGGDQEEILRALERRFKAVL